MEEVSSIASQTKPEVKSTPLISDNNSQTSAWPQAAPATPPKNPDENKATCD